jgi:hypothetical protein
MFFSNWGCVSSVGKGPHLGTDSLAQVSRSYPSWSHNNISQRSSSTSQGRNYQHNSPFMGSVFIHQSDWIGIFDVIVSGLNIAKYPPGCTHLLLLTFLSLANLTAKFFYPYLKVFFIIHFHYIFLYYQFWLRSYLQLTKYLLHNCNWIEFSSKFNHFQCWYRFNFVILAFQTNFIFYLFNCSSGCCLFATVTKLSLLLLFFHIIDADESILFNNIIFKLIPLNLTFNFFLH